MITPIRRLSELRSTLEAFGASRAAVQLARNKEEIARLRAIVKQVNRGLSARNYPAFCKADFEFHSAVMAAADVPLLQQIWKDIWKGLLTFHRDGFNQATPDSRVLIGEHDYLIETIAHGDPVAAADAARCHVEANWFRQNKQDAENAECGPDTLYRAVAHITSHLHCKLRIDDLAKDVACTSVRNLSRLFRQQYGMSLHAHLQKLRMEKAGELLRSTHLPVSLIAQRVGYRDVSRFSEHFKRQFHATPNRWRRAE